MQKGAQVMKRICWVIYSFLALGFGALLYGLYRQDTYIGEFIGDIISVSLQIDGFLSAFAAWYLPDFLWMFSLNCALFAVVLPKDREVFLWSTVALSMGVLWETLQLFGFVSGTADLLDILMYSMAAFSAAMIALFIKKESKK